MGCGAGAAQAALRRAARARRAARRRRAVLVAGVGGRRAGEGRMGGSDATIAGEAAALMHLQLDGVLLAGGRHQLDEWPAEASGARVELPAAPPLREHSALVH